VDHGIAFWWKPGMMATDLSTKMHSDPNYVQSRIHYLKKHGVLLDPKEEPKEEEEPVKSPTLTKRKIEHVEDLEFTPESMAPKIRHKHQMDVDKKIQDIYDDLKSKDGWRFEGTSMIKTCACLVRQEHQWDVQHELSKRLLALGWVVDIKSTNDSMFVTLSATL